MRLKAIFWGVLGLCQVLQTIAQYSNAKIEQDNLSVLDSPSELERLVFNVYNGRHWLLLFHHDHCNKCVYESIQAIAFAKWIRDLGLDPPLHLGVISCSKNEDEWRESASFKDHCNKSSSDEDRMFLVKPQSQSLQSDAIPLPNSHLKHLERLQIAIGSHLRGNWTSLEEQELLSSMRDSSKSEILLDWPDNSANNEILIVAEMDLSRKRIWIHRRTGDKSNYGQVLNFVRNQDNSFPRLRDNLDNSAVCDAWRPNWLLNILSSFLCPKSEHPDCDIERDLFSVLDLMSAKEETFSVRGFESKFKDICRLHREELEESGGTETEIDGQENQPKSQGGQTVPLTTQERLSQINQKHQQQKKQQKKQQQQQQQKKQQQQQQQQRQELEQLKQKQQQQRNQQSPSSTQRPLNQKILMNSQQTSPQLVGTKEIDSYLATTEQLELTTTSMNQPLTLVRTPVTFLSPSSPIEVVKVEGSTETNLIRRPLTPNTTTPLRGPSIRLPPPKTKPTFPRNPEVITQMEQMITERINSWTSQHSTQSNQNPLHPTTTLNAPSGTQQVFESDPDLTTPLSHPVLRPTRPTVTSIRNPTSLPPADLGMRSTNPTRKRESPRDHPYSVMIMTRPTEMMDTSPMDLGLSETAHPFQFPTPPSSLSSSLSSLDSYEELLDQNEVESSTPLASTNGPGSLSVLSESISPYNKGDPGSTFLSSKGDQLSSSTIPPPSPFSNSDAQHGLQPDRNISMVVANSPRSFYPESTLSYVSRYLNMMDELGPSMIRYRLEQIFPSLQSALLVTATTLEPQSQLPELLRTSNPEWRFNRECIERDRGKSFVTNHLRDVVYTRDLERALKLSLSSLSGLDLESGIAIRDVEAKGIISAYVELLQDFYPFPRDEEGVKLRKYVHLLSRFLNKRRRQPRRSFSLARLNTFNDQLRSILEVDSNRHRRPRPTDHHLHSSTMPSSDDKEHEPWMGCSNSENGYPCALWQLFHVLTVQHAHDWKWNSDFKRHDILAILYEYVRYFYHSTSKSLFMRTYQMNPPHPDLNPEESALWLWAAHNKINQYLYDLEVAKNVRRTPKSLEKSRLMAPWREEPNVCRSQSFPDSSICSLCYAANGKFRSKRAILRYLYAVFTEGKIISSEDLS